MLPSTFHRFLEAFGDIDDAITNYKYRNIYLSRNVFLRVQPQYKTIDIRLWFCNDNEKNNMNPTRYGVNFRFSEFESLKEIALSFKKDIPFIERCFHHGQEEMLQCIECNGQVM